MLARGGNRAGYSGDQVERTRPKLDLGGMANVEIGNSQLCDQMRSGRDQLERPRASLTERYEWRGDEREPDRDKNYRARSQRTQQWVLRTKDEEPHAAQAVPWIEEARGAMGSYGV